MTEETKKEFIKAFNEHSDAIFRYCFMRIGDREMAKDLTQNAFLKTWDYMCKNKEVRNLKSFLYKVAGNSIVDYYRAKKTFSLEALFETENYDPTWPEEYSAEEKIDASIAFNLLDKIPKEYKDVVVLRYVEGLSFREISEITDESENTVTVRFHRAVKKIKELFNQKDKKENEQ